MRIDKMTSLSTEEYQHVVHLMKLCEEHDQLAISTSINLSMLKKAEDGQLNLLLAYEKMVLVGFLGIYSFVDKKKVEIAGMVHPAYRSQGRFGLLLEKAWQICHEREVNEILLVCPANSVAAKGLMKKLAVSYSFSEYTMEFFEMNSKAIAKDIILEFKPAEAADIQVIVQLFRDGFDFDQSDDSILPLLKRNLSKDGFELYIIKDQDQGIATLTISDEESAMYISAFTVTPNKRGKGIGREILKMAIERIEEKHPSRKIRLDVDVKNSNALKLYEAVGFQKLSGYDYYLYEGKK
ncbi:GNAT family N-acetyltransferase [Sutcliffiella halmapala]|uniref:GNAT family N-acetyltransferase n=1 Tax=Sutcliffiella halmapala TaxID=79882 RepID=UPI0009957F93|nr:GNAT family N-acetyltransferase [Sutcliffiella halmapala]